MKHLIFKKLEDGTFGEKLGSYEGAKDDSSANRSHLQAEPQASHFELPEGLDEEVVKPALVDDAWVLQDDAALVAAKAARVKAALVQVAYDQMNADVYAQMAVVFGTSNAESATAYNETYKLMKEFPADYVGGALANEAAVIALADSKLALIRAYAVFRITRIEQFKAEKETILNG